MTITDLCRAEAAAKRALVVWGAANIPDRFDRAEFARLNEAFTVARLARELAAAALLDAVA